MGDTPSGAPAAAPEAPVELLEKFGEYLAIVDERLEALRCDAEEARAAIAEAQETLRACAEDRAQLDTSIDELEASINGNEGYMTEKEETLLAPIRKEVAGNESNSLRVRNTLRDLSSEIQRAERVVRDVEETIAGIQRSLQSGGSKLPVPTYLQLQRNLATHSTRFRDAQVACAQLRVQRDEGDRQLAQATQELAAAKGKLAAMEQALDFDAMKKGTAGWREDIKRARAYIREDVEPREREATENKGRNERKLAPLDEQITIWDARRVWLVRHQEQTTALRDVVFPALDGMNAKVGDSREALLRDLPSVLGEVTRLRGVLDDVERRAQGLQRDGGNEPLEKAALALTAITNRALLYRESLARALDVLSVETFKPENTVVHSPVLGSEAAVDLKSAHEAAQAVVDELGVIAVALRDLAADATVRGTVDALGMNFTETAGELAGSHRLVSGPAEPAAPADAEAPAATPPPAESAPAADVAPTEPAPADDAKRGGDEEPLADTDLEPAEEEGEQPAPAGDDDEALEI